MILAIYDEKNGERDMLDKKFWDDYQTRNRNPITRFFYRNQIKEQEQMIEKELDFKWHHYAYDQMNLKDFDENREWYRKTVNILTRQKRILEDSFLYPKEKLENLHSEISDATDEILINYGSQWRDNIVESNLVKDNVIKVIEQAQRELKEEGKYLADSIQLEKALVSGSVEIDIGVGGFYGVRGIDTFNTIPTVSDLKKLAHDYGVVTRVSPEIQDEIYSKLDQINFGTDDHPYSYKTTVYDLTEVNDNLSVYIFDDADQGVDILKYDPIKDSWNGIEHGFQVKNEVEGLKEIYRPLLYNQLSDNELSHVSHKVKENEVSEIIMAYDVGSNRMLTPDKQVADHTEVKENFQKYVRQLNFAEKQYVEKYLAYENGLLSNPIVKSETQAQLIELNEAKKFMTEQTIESVTEKLQGFITNDYANTYQKLHVSDALYSLENHQLDTQLINEAAHNDKEQGEKDVSDPTPKESPVDEKTNELSQEGIVIVKQATKTNTIKAPQNTLSK